MRRRDCHDHIKAIIRGHQTALDTVKAFIDLAVQEPEYRYKLKVGMAELRSLAGDLHDAYFIRMLLALNPVCGITGEPRSGTPSL